MDDGKLPEGPEDDPAPAPLLRDLEKVAELASALLGRVERSNTRLDPDVEEALKQMLESLGHLPDGLWRQAKAPLEAALEFLPEVRSQYLPAAEDADEDPDAPPSPSRNEGWDDALRNLIGEVATANRALLRELRLNDPPPSDAFEVEGAMATAAAQVADKARDFAAETEAATTELDQIAVAGSARADTLRRALWSSTNMGRAASAIFGLPRVLPSKARALYEAAGKMPGILRSAADGMERAEDILGPSWNVWRKLRARIKTGIVDTYEDLKTSMRETAARIEGPETATPMPSPPEDDDPEVPDDVREAAEARVREAILAGDPPASADVRLARTLDISGGDPEPGEGFERRAIPRPELIGQLRNLRWFNGAWTSIHTLEFLPVLTKLRQVSLSQTVVADIAPLADLQSLRNLYLMKTQVTDIAPLAGLQSLWNLDLRNTQVADIAPLADLQSLQHLDLRNAQVADIAPLADLQSLQILDLSNTQVADIAPLADLQSLWNLDLRNTQVADIAPLADMQSLQYLDLSRTQVADIAPLADLQSLRTLDLTNTQVVDFGPVDHVPRVYGRPDD